MKSHTTYLDFYFSILHLKSHKIMQGKSNKINKRKNCQEKIFHMEFKFPTIYSTAKKTRNFVTTH